MPSSDVVDVDAPSGSYGLGSIYQDVTAPKSQKPKKNRDKPRTLKIEDVDTARDEYYAADDAWFEYQLNNPGLSFDKKTGQWGRYETKTTTNEDFGITTEKEVFTPDERANSVWLNAQQAERNLERAEQKAKDDKAAADGRTKSYRDSAAAARAYAEAERAADKFAFEKAQRPSKEVERQFADFVDRAKTFYDLQDSERGYAMDAQDANRETSDWVAESGAPIGGQMWFGSDRPGERMSQAVYPTIPAAPPPDYRLNDAVGLPGGSGFAYPRMGDQPDPSIIGFARGTDIQGDPELEWMIGMPFFPRNPNAEVTPVPESWMRNRQPRVAMPRA